MTNLKELKDNIETLAQERNQTALEIITTLQGVAAKTGNDELLEDLCELKHEYITTKFF